MTDDPLEKAVDRAWREALILELRAEIERLRAENTQLRADIDGLTKR